MAGNLIEKKIVLFAAAAGLVASPAFGILVRDDRTQEAYLGAAQDEMFRPVGKVVRNGILRGGGVLVSERFVLTSAGNVINTTPDEFEFEFNIGGEMYDVASIKIHPKFYNDPINGADLALVELAQDVPAEIKPASVYGGSDEMGREAILAGPGTSGPGAGGGLFQDGQFRAGTNMIDEVFDDGKIAWLKTDFDNPNSSTPNPLGSDTPTDMEFGMGSGDFGAPLFIELNGRKFVAGVASYFTPNALYGSTNFYTRVSHYADFFEDCGIIVEVPAPASLAMIGLGVLLSGGRRRR